MLPLHHIAKAMAGFEPAPGVPLCFLHQTCGSLLKTWPPSQLQPHDCHADEQQDGEFGWLVHVLNTAGRALLRLTFDRSGLVFATHAESHTMLSPGSVTVSVSACLVRA